MPPPPRDTPAGRYPDRVPAQSPIERLVIAEIDRRRSYVRPPRDVTLHATLDRVEQALRASARQESALQAAWRRLAPAELAARVRPVSLKGGVLTLSASDQSARYLADRWLTPATRAALAGSMNTLISRVSVKIAKA